MVAGRSFNRSGFCRVDSNADSVRQANPGGHGQVLTTLLAKSDFLISSASWQRRSARPRPAGDCRRSLTRSSTIEKSSSWRGTVKTWRASRQRELQSGRRAGRMCLRSSSACRDLTRSFAATSLRHAVGALDCLVIHGHAPRHVDPDRSRAGPGHAPCRRGRRDRGDHRIGVATGRPASRRASPAGA